MQKKTGTKTLALLFCAVLIAAVSVFTTVAFLKDSDSVKNTFTVGKVAITLDEAKVDGYGTAVAGASRVKGNSYKLIPGHEYKKDPTVHFAAGSEASYLFVRVEDGIAQIEAGTTIAAQILANGWQELADVDGVYWKQVQANTGTTAVDYAVFDSFTLKGEADVDAYANAKITVTAYAIQADGFADAAAAWTAGNFR